ncbi:endo-1,4-beta-xylanase [Winogradskya humida]|uniref:endo-1,4-beta-xylanase n=1 Tax=Winogradskya humida TaxID=113566 RepID=UPI001EF26302|nr:endo-1,4-beta-xylanase [Actinoplanes humidus]
MLAVLTTAGAATLVAAPGPVAAETARQAQTTRPPKDSLGALGSRIGLRIGNAVNDDKLTTDATYTAILAGQFTTVTAENAMKWEVVEPSRGVNDFAAADRLVTFAAAHRQLVRGHTLLWHNQIPGWLTSGVTDGSISRSELRTILKRHVTTEVTHFKGKIWQWDVANEFFTDSTPSTINPNDFWVANLGEGIIADVFRWARAADPRALLFYNDYNIAGEDGTNAKADAVHAWAKGLKRQGVPIDGIGDQGHLDTQYPFPTTMTANLRRYEAAGFKVAITEADVRTFVDNATDQNPTDALALMAQPYEFSQMLKACLAVRACISFTVWGVNDRDSWIPGFFTDPLQGYATLHDVHLQPKPAFTTLQQDLTLAAGGAPRRTSA